MATYLFVVLYELEFFLEDNIAIVTFELINVMAVSHMSQQFCCGSKSSAAVLHFAFFRALS